MVNGNINMNIDKPVILFEAFELNAVISRPYEEFICIVVTYTIQEDNS